MTTTEMRALAEADNASAGKLRAALCEAITRIDVLVERVSELETEAASLLRYRAVDGVSQVKP